MPFDNVFIRNADGSVTTRTTIRVGGITVGANTILRQGQTIAGLDFTQFIGRQLQVEIENGVYVIKGIYSQA